MLFLFKINFWGLYPRAPFKREGKRGREGKGKRDRAVGREVIGKEGKSWGRGGEGTRAGRGGREEMGGMGRDMRASSLSSQSPPLDTWIIACPVNSCIYILISCRIKSLRV
jgi:hypothetical protein